MEILLNSVIDLKKEVIYFVFCKMYYFLHFNIYYFFLYFQVYK